VLIPHPMFIGHCPRAVRISAISAILLALERGLMHLRSTCPLICKGSMEHGVHVRFSDDRRKGSWFPGRPNGFWFSDDILAHVVGLFMFRNDQ
jgi:hypothetical protein